MPKDLSDPQEELIKAEIDDVKTFKLDKDITMGHDLHEGGVQLIERAVRAYVTGREDKAEEIASKAVGYFRACFDGKQVGGTYPYDHSGEGLLYATWWSENRQDRSGIEKQLADLTAKLMSIKTKYDASIKEWFVQGVCMALETGNTKEANRLLDVLDTVRKRDEVGGWNVPYLRLLANLTNKTSIEAAQKQREAVLGKLVSDYVMGKWPIFLWDVLRFLDVTYKVLGYPRENAEFIDLVDIVKKDIKKRN